MPASNRPRLTTLLLLLLTLMVVGALVALASRSGSSTAPTSASSSSLEGAPLAAVAAPPFTLTDQNGQSISLAGTRGHVTVLSFLYTHCGAACNVIAQQIRGALDELARPVPVLIVTADPAGDDHASIERFLADNGLSSRAHFLTGPERTIRALWRAYRVTPASAGTRRFGEYAFVMLIDPRGRERAIYQLEELTPESLTHDIRTLEAG